MCPLCKNSFISAATKISDLMHVLLKIKEKGKRRGRDCESEKPMKGEFSMTISKRFARLYPICHIPLYSTSHTHTHLKPSSPPLPHFPCNSLRCITAEIYLLSACIMLVIIYIHFRKQQDRRVLAYANVKLGKIWATQRTPQ